MNSLADLQLAKVYHSPKDNVSDELTSPLITRSIHIRRSTGDISSSVFFLHRTALGRALANGNDFSMRWLTSNRVSAKDIDAVKDPGPLIFSDLKQGLRDEPSSGREREWCQRLLATLLNDGILEWNVVITKKGMYHEKGAIFDDASGDSVLLTGSWNETFQGYVENVERIDVHRSREDPERCDEAKTWFEKVWQGDEPNIRVLPVREAILNGLVETVEEPPWSSTVEKEANPSLWTPELLYLAIQDKVPWSLHDPYIGCLVEPMPHQVYVHKRVLSRPPARFLLADEVGLGKTIEAGLILSSLLSTGLARRILILGPANVLPQWDDELRERFGLNPWVLKGKYWVNEAIGERIKRSSPLFSRLPGTPPQILLVSRSLVSRSERLEDLKQSSWDLVILDEAHRARGHWEGPRYRRNNLLRALGSLADRTISVLLLTATPVQLYLHELHDLFSVLGLPPGWIGQDDIESFVENVNSQEPDWKYLFRMATASAEFYRNFSGLSRQEFEEDLLSGIEFFKDLTSGKDPVKRFRQLVDIIESFSHYEVGNLQDPEIRLLKVALYRMSPFYQLICRNTRELLRRYHKKRITKLRVPQREVRSPISVPLTDREMELYTAVREEYVRPLYRKYAKANLPSSSVGFVLTIYAKRAASSWFSLEKSLKRRLSRIEEALSKWPEGLKLLFGSLSLRDLTSEGVKEQEVETELDIPDDDFKEVDVKKVKLEDAHQAVLEEKEKINELLDELRGLRENDFDTKRDSLLSHLKKSLLKRRGVLVFSQYKDTIDYLSRMFQQEFGSSLVKYHGEGGEVLEGGKWKLVEKKVVEDRVSKGKVRVLLATDAASEGLNLQALDAIVNYDIPWNPMKIEQRIGRIDRVTQQSETIAVDVLVPEGTVEEDVYSRCLERLGLFRQSLGPIQPILVEEFMKKELIGEEKIEWKDVEEDWRVAKDHASLFEMALAAHDPRGQWKKRREIEEKSLAGLLNFLGFSRDNGLWIRDDSRVRVGTDENDATRLTAAPYNKAFVSLVAELGPMPDEIQHDGLTYRVIDCGDSKVLALKHHDGGIYVVEDLVNIRAEGGIQVGRDWADVRDFANRLEKERERSHMRFRERQRVIRKDEWRKDVENGVLRALVRWAKGDIRKAAERMCSDPDLSQIGQRYLILPEDMSVRQATNLLMRWKAKTRGKPPSLPRIIARAKELK